MTQIRTANNILEAAHDAHYNPLKSTKQLKPFNVRVEPFLKQRTRAVLDKRMFDDAGIFLQSSHLRPNKSSAKLPSLSSSAVSANHSLEHKRPSLRTGGLLPRKKRLPSLAELESLYRNHK